MICAEIDAGRPVIYSGATKNDEGHAWIVDGYNSDGYLHINWGWGSDFDGFFLPDRMILQTTLFDRELDAIVGVRPSTETPLLWTMQSSGFKKVNRGIQNISAVNELVAWASAYDGTISNGQCMDFCRTTDGGESWQTGTVNIPKNESYTISSISAVSALEAWASVYVSINSSTLTGGKIAHTTDGGKTWTVQPTAEFSSKNGFPNIVHFWDNLNGVCIGDPNGGYFEIYTTSDGGNQWTRVPASRIPANNRGEAGIVGSFSICGNTIFFGTDAGRLFRSIDRGATWTVATTPLKTNFKLAFRDNNTGIIALASSKYTAYRTTDGGSTWQQLPADNHFFATNFAYIPGTDTLVCVGINRNASTGLAFSTDDGSSFQNFADFYTDLDQYTAVGIEPGGKGMWAGSVNYGEHYGGMWHRGATPVVRDNTVYSSLAQNNNVTGTLVAVYPNPATDEVIVECPQPMTRIEIISMQGVIVKRIETDSNRYTLFVADLPEGVYLVRASQINGIIQFGRIVKRRVAGF